MRYSVAALLAFAASSLAQTAGFDAISQPAKDISVPAGKTFTIEWEPSTKYDGTVTLTLLGGASPSTLQLLDPITTHVKSSAGKYEWAVSKSLGEFATYGIKLSLDSDESVFQYSFPFKIAKSAAAGSSSVATTSATSSSVVVPATSATSATSVSSTSAATTSAVSTVSTVATVLSTVSCSSSSASTVSAHVSSAAVLTTSAPWTTAVPTTFSTKAGNATITTKVSGTKTGAGSAATSAVIVTSAASPLSAVGSLMALAAFAAMYATL